MIGDSYLALTGDVYRYLQTKSGQNYKTYYMSGAQMADIRNQATAAANEGPVETVIMDGGGNDVLLGNPTCGLTNSCGGTITRAMDTAKQLMSDAAAHGIVEVIFFFYPHVGGFAAALNGVLDAAYPQARDLCENATSIHCSFIDLRPSFEGNAGYLMVDGIHPSAQGSEVIANLIWDKMQFNCEHGIPLKK
jgi:lysophospholipase L1-like esterase